MHVVATADEIIVRERDGAAFLLHVPSGRYFGLNPSGVVIWSALLAGVDPMEALAKAWPDVPEERRLADANGLLQALVEAGLAREVGVTGR